MGLGGIDHIDPDLVEDSNRNRQLFTAPDVGLPKAHQVIRNVEPFATQPTLLRGYFMTFEDWAKTGRRKPRYEAICCGVDSIPTMVAVARYGLRTNTPVVFINVSKDGEACRLFIQRCLPEQACFACYMPRAVMHKVERDQPCIPLPAIADILHVAVGLAARAAIGEILASPIGSYNCRDLTFSGLDVVRNIPKNEDCPLCGRQAEC